MQNLVAVAKKHQRLRSALTSLVRRLPQRRQPVLLMGQTEKNSVRANVFRFAVQSARPTACIVFVDYDFSEFCCL
jgi:hypothetical protein